MKRTITIDLGQALTVAEGTNTELSLINPVPCNLEDERRFADVIDRAIDVLSCDTESDVYAAVLTLGIKIGMNYAATDIVRRLDVASIRKIEVAA